jgi:uracil-DNA glycosylase
MSVKIEKSWEEVLQQEFEKDYFKNLIQFIKTEYNTQTIFPPGSQIFNAFEKCPFDQI